MKTYRTPHEIACDLVKQYPNTGALSEADVRHRVIDVVLHEILAWPRAAVICESYIDPGYADYVLTGKGESQLVFVEAKREGASFTLPNSVTEKRNSAAIKIKALLTDDITAKALNQVQDYCIKAGCEYAAITNGHQWVFFKTFERHHDWRDLNAFVVCSLRFFSESFIEAENLLSYGSLTEKASLALKLGAAKRLVRERFYPKSKVPEYHYEIQQNVLASCIRPLAERYLGKMNPTDDQFMEECYVRIRDYQASMTGVSGIINDSLTPYFKNFNVREFFDDTQGGIFGSRIESNLRERRTRDVIVLFGGKGSGKTTFLRKLLYHRPLGTVKHHAQLATVDLLECPPDKRQIEAEIWKQLLVELDTEKILLSERSLLLSLFNDRFEQARKQTLAGLQRSGEAYNLQLNSLVTQWLGDSQYCIARLADFWKTKQKGTLIILDNTDQYTPELQEYCFTLAQQIATLVDGIVVISMREERFYESRLHGTLDAFQNSGFHLSSPPASFVFVKRLVYMLRVLDDKEGTRKLSSGITYERNEQIKMLFRNLLMEFRRSPSHLNQFLRACAHGNMRLSLDMFRDFLLSGYTKVDEIFSTRGYTLQIHQVLRPMMIPARFFYDETRSCIPNLFQVRSDTAGSHFTALRILDILAENQSPLNPVFVSVATLKGIFASKYKMLEDLCKNLDMMLKTGILEANNRLDAYSESVDSVKITPYGFYMRDNLSGMFTYLDLICIDCGVHDQSVANSLAVMASNEYSLLRSGQIGDRIELRLKRVELFVNYLIQESEIERDTLGLAPNEVRYGKQIMDQFLREREVVRSSARRYITKRTPQDTGRPFEGGAFDGLKLD